MSTVRVFHAHVYFDPQQREQAVHLRSEVQRRYRVPVGRVHDRPVGPHPKGMFQVLIDRECVGDVLPYLMQHRDGLDILLHPDTGNDLADHTEHAAWIGSPLPLRLEMFRAAASA